MQAGFTSRSSEAIQTVTTINENDRNEHQNTQSEAIKSTSKIQSEIASNQNDSKVIIYEIVDIVKQAGHIFHCVSKDLAMGVGVAKQIKCRLGPPNESSRINKEIGDVITQVSKTRIIFLLITK
jgi:hypothetical protein